MDDRDPRVKKIMERFGDAPISEDPSVQQLKKMLDDFLENGPGTRQERERVLFERLLEMDTSYADFLSKRH